jgi:DNA-binding GntR family transcriptional regulator
VKIEIDPSSSVHPYRQLADRLREQIASGEITNQLPSITKLTEATTLAVGTVRRGIDILVKEGLVETVPGRGTFVIDQRPSTSGSASGPAGGREARGRPPAGRPSAGRTRSSDVPRPHGHVRH